MQCPYCNSENQEGVKFCKQCGSPIETDQPVHSGFKPLLDRPATTTDPFPAHGSKSEEFPLPEQIRKITAVRPKLGRQSSLGIVSLVIGLMSLCGWVFPTCGIPFSILGLALGFLGLRKSPGGIAKAGMALCSLGLVVTFIFSTLGVASGLGDFFSDIYYLLQ